jgi:hypothetical protein
MGTMDNVGDACYYDKYYSTRSWDFYQPLLVPIIMYSKPGPILDIGAGTG